MTKSKNKEYQVQAAIKNVVSISINAVSLDEAVSKAKELTESAFIEILGDNIDGSFHVTGVYESYVQTE